MHVSATTGKCRALSTQVKESYGNLDMVTCRFSSCKPEWRQAVYI